MAKNSKPNQSTSSSPRSIPNIHEVLKSITSGKAVKRNTFNSISWAYLNEANRDQFINDLVSVNKDFGETLLLFSNSLHDVEGNKLKCQEIIDQMYRHYVINTNGPIPVQATELLSSDEDDHFDVFKEAEEYAKIINVGVHPGPDNASILHFNEKKIPCPSWGVLPKKTAAYSLRKVGPVINKVRYGRNDVVPSTLFKFKEDGRRHSLQNAMKLADLAHLAYLKPGYIQQQLEAWDYDFFEWIEDEEIDTQSYIAGKQNRIVICFRGTGSRKDWFTDANLFTTDSHDGRGRVHTGFKRALDAVWDRIHTILQSLDSSKRFYFVGHSLGAALAQLAAYRQATIDLERIAGVYVYGSPRIGNKRYKSAYDTLIGDLTHLHINNTDLVTRVPPTIFGYRHMGGTPLKFDTTHTIVSDFELAPISEMVVESMDDLDITQRQKIRKELDDANASIRKATQFLRVRPQDLADRAYEATFDRGTLDEHGADQYLFKLACAIIDRKFRMLENN